VNLPELTKRALPRCPLAADLALHWLVVEGVQPKIPENPSTAPWNPQDHPTSLSREMQYYYTSTTNAIRGQDMSHLPGIFNSFARDSGLQDLIPYYSRFIFREVRDPDRSLPLLNCLVRTVGAFARNPNVQLQYHLHQLMPAIFTCVVGAKLSSSPLEEHWTVRRAAARVVATVVKRLESEVPDLRVRVCKTYIDSFQEDKSLASLYGGIVGLISLGQAEVKSVLVPSLHRISRRLHERGREHVSVSGGQAAAMPEHDRNGNEEEEDEVDGRHPRTSGRLILLQAVADLEARARCRDALSEGLGRHMVLRMRLSSVYDMGQGSDGGGGGEYLGLGMGGAGQLTEEQARQAESTAQLIHDLGESLVPYHATSSRPLDHCRMIF
jgi:hypothetical protein